MYNCYGRNGKPAPTPTTENLDEFIDTFLASTQERAINVTLGAFIFRRDTVLRSKSFASW
jgi:hypothetical protein